MCFLKFNEIHIINIVYYIRCQRKVEKVKMMVLRIMMQKSSFLSSGLSNYNLKLLMSKSVLIGQRHLKRN